MGEGMTISTHVLDTERGRPAPGVRIDIYTARDLVAGLVLSAPHRVDRLVVGGDDVVRGCVLVRADESEIARAHRVQARRFAA